MEADTSDLELIRVALRDTLSELPDDGSVDGETALNTFYKVLTDAIEARSRARPAERTCLYCGELLPLHKPWCEKYSPAPRLPDPEPGP